MRVINKKMVVVILLIIEFTCGYLMYQSSKKEVDLAKVTYEEEIKDSMFAMYVENEDTGEYDEITNTNTFPEGYILNIDKTGCIDNKGNSVSDILTSKDDKVMVKSNKTVFCYLYFDKDNRVYTQVKSDYKNNTGAILLSETESDEYPVYYYNGNITNNNILYANFCWKMVRTTETGGVKLIYNGVPDKSEDGTLTCDNTGEESQIGTSAFNPSTKSPAYVGYMYNKVYNYLSKTFDESTNILTIEYYGPTYYFGDTATWNPETNQYELSNSDGSEVKIYTWSNDYADLVGYYTCRSKNSITCETVNHIVGGTSGNMYRYSLSEGKDYTNYKIKLAPSVTNNEVGIYTLNNPIEITRMDFYSNFSTYKNYYYCGDLISETCENMYHSYSYTNGVKISNNYKYGNSFKYENGIYTLVDTKEFWNWSENYNTLNSNHYTCFNTTGECTSVKYIYYTNSSSALYIELINGKTIEDAIDEMLYAEDVNSINSTIKIYIDDWYENSILGKTDNEGILYSLYLENTIFCNNREISDLGGWNPNGGDITKAMGFNYNSLECENKTDQFSLKVEAGGTEGYGNNVLDYPVGLISYKEANLANLAGYLKSGSNYWLLSPVNFYFWYTLIFEVTGHSLGDRTHGVRPSLSLSNKVEITSGNGEVDNPYQVILSN